MVAVLKKLVERFIVMMSFVSIIIISYNFVVCPMNTGRIILYLFLLIPLILIFIDMGLGEILSNRINNVLGRRSTIIVTAMIIIVGLLSVTLWSRSHVDNLLNMKDSSGIGVMYPGDISSIWVMAISVAIFTVYYFITMLYESFTPGKNTSRK